MANNITNLDADLLRVYSREKLFEPCERSEKRFWDDIQEADEENPRGKGRFFRIIGNSGHAQGTPSDGGDWSTSRTRRQVECSVTSAQIDSVIEVTEKFFNASEGEGSYGGDAEHDAIVEATQGLYEYAQKLLACGHGTGRLAVVAASVTSSTTWTAKLPEYAFQLRPNQTVEFADLDSGGTVQTTGRILAINYRTGLVTMAAAVTLTANWGVYQIDTYGKAKPNGLRNIVDDGDFASTIFGASRTDNDYLNAYNQDGNGGLQDYSEELMGDFLDQIAYIQNKVPTELRSNKGIIREHLRVTTPDRVVPVAGGKQPTFGLGANQSKIYFQYNDTQIPFVSDSDLPARELFAIHKPALRKHTLRKADWFKRNGSIFQMKPASGGETYTYAWIASMLMDMTMSSRPINCHGKLSNVRDRGSARDA